MTLEIRVGIKRSIIAVFLRRFLRSEIRKHGIEHFEKSRYFFCGIIKAFTRQNNITNTRGV